MGAIFVDIEKAFDRVWHNGLLYKLDKLKVPDYLGKWIRNYLDNRSFQVRIGSSLSSVRPVEAGVPQGSVLGPVLFNLFFNDITEKRVAKVELGLFADDLSAWTCDKSLKRINLRIQAQLNHIESWMNKWQTTLSVSKTVWTVFSKIVDVAIMILT
jgi:retron-type reverse transcriptase